MSFAAEPYAQFVDTLLTSLTGGVTREEFRFLPEERPFRLTPPGPVVPSTVRVYGQSGGQFRLFQVRTDYVVGAEFTIDWKMQPDGAPMADAVLPDDGTSFYANYEAAAPGGPAPPLTDRNPGSVTRLLAESFAREYAVLSRQLEAVYRGAYVDTAASRDLDQVAGLVGVERRAADFAVGQVLFSRSTPSPADIFIPSGTRLSTAAPPVAVFETTAPVTLRRGGLSVDAPIQAVERGQGGVVSAQTIQIVNRPVLGIESVNNPQGTQFANEDETDEQLRSRVRRALEGAGMATTGALLSALTSIPGVREKDVQVLDDPIDHPGLIQINLALSTSLAGRQQDVFDRAVELIEHVRPVGVRVVHNIDAPAPAGPAQPNPGVEPPADPAPAVFGDAEPGELILAVDFVVRLTPSVRSPAEAERTELERKATSAVTAFVEEAGFGEALVYNKLVAHLMAIPGLLDVSLEMFPKNAPEGPRHKNVMPTGLSVRPVAGTIDVRVGGSVIVIDLSLRVAPQGAGKDTPPETVSSAAASEITLRLNDSFRLALPQEITAEQLTVLAGESEEYRIKDVQYAVEFLDSGVRLLQHNPTVHPGASDQIWIRKVSVSVEPA